MVVLPFLVAGALVAQGGLAGPAHAATARFAAPTGTSTASCLSAATACNLEKAIAGAANDDQVFLAAGTYATSTVLASSAKRLVVRGTPGQARPVIDSSASTALSLSGTGVQVTDLTIRHDGSQYGLNLFTTSTTVTRVDVRSTGGVACSPGISGVIRDSTCVASGVGAVALDNSYSGGSGTLTLRNVTAVATGAGSLGLRADAAGASTAILIEARNVIASGAGADVRATQTGRNSASFVLLRSSNYESVEDSGGAGVTPPGSGSNQVAAPVFADADFHQAAGSPTIDAGTVDESTGSLDLDYQARPWGAAMDIGADELYPDTTAPDTVLQRTPKHRTRKRKAVFTFVANEPATFSCLVDRRGAVPCTSPFKIKLKKRGRHTLRVVARDTAGNLDASPAGYTWKIRPRKRHRR